MPNIELIRQTFIDRKANHSPETLRVQLFWFDKWMKFAGSKEYSEWNKSLVLAFRRKLEAEADGGNHYKSSTIRGALQVVRSVFDAASSTFKVEQDKAIQAVNTLEPAATATLLKLIGQKGPEVGSGQSLATGTAK